MNKIKNLTKENNITPRKKSRKNATNMRTRQNEIAINPTSDLNFIKEIIDNFIKNSDKRAEEANRKNEEANRKNEEANRRHEEANKRHEEAKRRQEEADLIWNRKWEEMKKEIYETGMRIDESIKQIKESNKQIGGILNSNGDIAESYFINSFTKRMYFAGQEFDSIDTNLGRKSKKLNLQAEYDIVMYNCTSVAIIEVKYKVDCEDIEEILAKPQTFKQLFPQYSNYAIYLGVAGLYLDKTAITEAKKQGIGIIKQVGENMVVNDKHLKAF
jgi:hypothetical protein